MASSRLINTNFWRDAYIAELDPLETYLFLYFLSNDHTTLAGIYELTMRDIVHESKCTEEFVRKTLQKFQIAGKIYYERNWIILTNFIKHQRLNPSMIRGIEKALEELPDWLQSVVSLDENEGSPQISIFDGGEGFPQDRLLPDSPQRKEIKRNVIKLKEKKSKQQVAGDSKESNKPPAAQYRKAVEADEELARKAKRSFDRKATKPEPIDVEAAYEKRTHKG